MHPNDQIAITPWIDKYRRQILTLILALSFGLRVWLATTGGQGYWPDEMRYSSASREAAWQFINGSSRDAWLQLIGQADHLLFKIIGLPVAFWELKFGQSGILAASWFGVFSVLTILLTYAIAAASGAKARESLLAAVFAAGSNSLFYYCRHFFPYDVSLFFCLLALFLALSTEKWWKSPMVGLSAGLGFLSYNGYWALGGSILIFHVLSAPTWIKFIKRSIYSGLGLMAPILTVILAAKLINRDLISSYLTFSKTITQGDFGSGWSLICDYLFNSEGPILITWLTLIIAGLIFSSDRNRLKLWIIFASGLYLCLTACSDFFHLFVVYGRTARILVPFLCLGAAAGMDSLISRWPTRIIWFVPATILILSVISHISEALNQVFPVDFIDHAKAQAHLSRLRSPVLLRVLNAGPLWEGYVTSEHRAHDILLNKKHPLQFTPYLFEGFNKELRSRYRREDISMKLITVTNLNLPDIGQGFPGPLKILVKFPLNQPGVSEPLITSGKPGLANFIYIRYIGNTHVQFGYDCWGAGGPISQPIAIDFSQIHEIQIISGAQLPLTPDLQRKLDPLDVNKLAGMLVVVLDGNVVIAERVATHIVDPNTLFLGMNLAGGSSARENFSGEVLKITPLSPKEILGLLTVGLSEQSLPGILMATNLDISWKKYCGPIRLKLRFPLGVVGQSEPLIVTGNTGKGDFIYVRYLTDGKVVIGLDHWGVGGAESAPVTLNQSRQAEVVISSGAMMPAKTDTLYTLRPQLLALCDNVIVSIDGNVVINQKSQFHPTLPSNIILGQNLIGGSTTQKYFSGEIYSVISEPAILESGILK